MQKKYIIIPYDFKPLFALRRKLGPSMGPIKKPILCDIQDIHDLLMQKHGNELRIFEVELTNGELRQDYQNPVKLTLENYKLPYAEIYAMEHKVEEEKVPTTPQPPVPSPTQPPQPPVTEEPELETEEPEAPDPSTEEETDPEVHTTPQAQTDGGHEEGVEEHAEEREDAAEEPEELQGTEAEAGDEASPVADVVEETPTPKHQPKSIKKRR